MAATRNRITKAQFHRINRFIKDQKAKGVYNAIHIAKHFEVSRETVSSIQRAGTWPKFEANKVERRQRASMRKRGGGAVLSIMDSELRPMQLPLTPAPKRYVTVELTRDEYLEIISLRERVEALEDWRKNQLDAEKAAIALHNADELQPRRRRWFGGRR